MSMTSLFIRTASAAAVYGMALILLPAADAAGVHERYEPLPLTVAASVRKPIAGATAVSPGGQQIAFVVTNWRNQRPRPPGQEFFSSTGANGDAEGTAMGRELWLKDLQTGELVFLNDGTSESWAPSWSMDGAQLAFYSDRDGAARLWVWDRKTRTARLVCKDIVRPNAEGDRPVWLPDGRHLFTKFLPEGETIESLSQAIAHHFATPQLGTFSGEKDELSVEVIHSRTPYMPWPGTIVHLADLGVVDSATGSVRRFASRLRVKTVSVSPDGTHLLADIWSDEQGNRLPAAQTTLMPLADGVRLKHWSDAEMFTVRWSSDGSLVAFTISTLDPLQRHVIVNVRSLQVLDVARRLRTPPGNEPAFFSRDGRYVYMTGADSTLWQVGTQRSPSIVRLRVPQNILAQGFLPSSGSASGSEMWLGVKRGIGLAQTSYVAFDPRTGKIDSILWNNESGHRVDHPVLVPGSLNTAFFRTERNGFPDLYLYRRDVRRTERLTDLNPQYDAYAPGKTISIEWQWAGVKQQGRLLLPAGYREGRRYPLLVEVYPSMARGVPLKPGTELFPAKSKPAEDWQVLATRGFAVLRMSPRFFPPSGEKGVLADSIYSSTMAAVDAVIDMGVADPDRLAVTGESQGGYGVRVLITRTDRFKAAISNVGLGGDLFAQYVELRGDGSLADPDRGALLNGDAWQKRDEWIANSPLYFYDKVNTPLIVQVGMNDPIGFTGYEAFAALKLLGKEAILLRYYGEGHWLSGYSNTLDFWQRRLEFLTRHLDLATDGQGAVVFDGDRARARAAGSPSK